MKALANTAGRIDAPPGGAALAWEPDRGQGAVLTREEYGDAYGAGYMRTMRYLLACGIGPELAEESAQAAWAKGWERRDQLRDPGCLLTWINRIALNVCRGQFRRPKLDELPADIPVPPAHGNPAKIDIQRALAGCTLAEREMVGGHYWSGYSSAELASRVSSSAGAVRIRLMRIRRRLRERLSA